MQVRKNNFQISPWINVIFRKLALAIIIIFLIRSNFWSALNTFYFSCHAGNFLINLIFFSANFDYYNTHNKHSENI